MRTQAAWIAISLVIAAPCARALDAVVIRSSGINLYDTAIKGFRDEFGGSLEVFSLKTEGLIKKIRDRQPGVIVAVGLSAAQAMTAAFSSIPIVFCMVMHQKQQELKVANATGVEIGPRPGEQLAAFARVIPGLRRLGLIYDPGVSGVFVSRVRKAAREMNLTLVTREVRRHNQVLDALRRVASRSDAVWLIRDRTVMRREFFNYALILQADRKVPLFAFSPVFVEKGALACFSSGYREQGRLVARIVKRILSGADPNGIPAQSPGGRLYLNTRTARVVGLKISPGLLDRPDVKALN